MEQEGSLGAGMVVIHKPFSPDTLVRTVHAALASRPAAEGLG